MRALILLFCLIILLSILSPAAASSLTLPPGSPYPDLNIEFDDYEVPTIIGDSLPAVAFGTGYAHAYHRLVQLDGLRRLGRGELAGLAGEGMLESDRMMRRLRLDETAEESLELCRPEEIAVLEAYSAGINFYIEHASLLPLEFALAGKPREWTPADSLVVARVMSWMLIDDFFGTVAAERRKSSVAPDFLKLMDLPVLESLTTHLSAELLEGAISLTVPDTLADAPVRSLAGGFSSLPSAPHPGSNCFVVSGALTVDGKPILASDPHLDISFPPIWYEVHMVPPEFEVRGMTVPGMPFVVMGANSHIAWGITSLGGDTADAIRYEVRGIEAGAGEYLTPEGWQPFDLVLEEYEIVDIMGKRVEVRSTRYTEAGPVFYYEEGSVIVLQWVGLLPDREGAAFLGINKAKSLTELRAAVDDMSTSQNVIACDLEGGMAYIPAGKYPVRGYDGSKIVDGGKTDVTWESFLTSSDFPAVLDLEEGFLVSANQQVYPLSVTAAGTIGGEVPLEVLLGGHRSFGHRALRIESLLDEADSNGPISREVMASIQCDTYSQLGVGFRDFAIQALEESGYARGAPDSVIAAAYMLLENWDGRLDIDSKGACVTFLMLEKTADRILKPRGYRSTRARFWHGALDYGRNLGGFWDDPNTEEIEGTAEILAWALEEAAAHLETTLGAPDEWAWGKLHRMDLTYPVPFLDKLAPGLVEAPGGYDTPWQGGSSLGDNGLFIQDFGPSMRIVVTPGEFGRSFWSVLPGGQSGNVEYNHSQDQLPLYLTGRYK